MLHIDLVAIKTSAGRHIGGIVFDSYSYLLYYGLGIEYKVTSRLAC